MDDLEVDASGHDEAPDSPPDSPQNATGASAIRRACDACRARKIRCDRNSPCSQCQHTKIECAYTVSRPKEKRSRILLTTQYERKIDLIDRRLQGVTQLLEDLKMNLSPSSSQLPKETPPSSSKTPQSTKAMQFSSTAPSDSNSPMVEGDSSLTAHSVFANEFLQKAVRTGSLQDSSLEMRETLDSLHHIVNTLKSQTGATELKYPNARPMQRAPIPGIELPPIEKTVAIFRLLKTQYFEGAAWFCDYYSAQRFPDLCLRVYFSDDYSETDFIMVNTGLYYLYWEQASRVEGAEAEQCLKWVHMCQSNLETALYNLPLHLPATSDSIIALVFGAFHGIELSKPSLSWTLTCKASELCQTLGYHRASSMKNDKPDEVEHKLLLFWSVYYLDKCLSLRLGRASTIPDWDVTVRDIIVEDPKEGPIAYYFCIWVRTARCQGKIYEQLYSPESLLQPDHVRIPRVHALVNELKEITLAAKKVDEQWIELAKHDQKGWSMIEFFAMSDKVLRLSLLTLVYRASPAPAGSPTTFSKECIEVARAALQAHQECTITLEGRSSIFLPSYVHWTVLFAPFTPFIVLFCQVIETRDQTDLARLHIFLTSVQSAPTFSDAAGKMYRLFQVLYSVALRYTELQNSTPPVEQAQASMEMDNYLAALGFPSMIFDGQQQAQATGFAQGDLLQGTGGTSVNPMMWMSNTAQLEDWFNSNQQMMGLLQESNFNFPTDNQQ